MYYFKKLCAAIEIISLLDLSPYRHNLMMSNFKTKYSFTKFKMGKDALPDKYPNREQTS